MPQYIRTQTHVITDSSGEKRSKLELLLWPKLNAFACAVVVIVPVVVAGFHCVFYYYLNIACVGDVSDSLLGVVAAQPRFADVSCRQSFSSTHTHTDTARSQLSLSLFHTREGGVLGWARM